MPNFVFKCESCSKEEVYNIPSAERDDPRECEHCKSLLKRQLASPPTVWNGGKNKGYNNSLRD